MEKFLVANIKATPTFFDNSTGVAKRIEEGEEMEEYNTSREIPDKMCEILNLFFFRHRGLLLAR